MTSTEIPVIIVGGGIAGLAGVRRLYEHGIAAMLLEADSSVGDRIKTNPHDG